MTTPVFPPLSESGQRVFNARYAAKNEDGAPIESFDDAVCRMADAAASAEPHASVRQEYTEKFRHMIGNLLFIPSSPIWANIGKPDCAWQPSACFVLAVEDSLASMYETLAQTAQVFKSGGGAGYNFSAIRPKGSPVRSTKGKASGVVELIRLYNASSNMVVQGGMRRGASIGILNIDHPEILGFICAKRNGGLENFNLSVGVTDAFMQCLHDKREWPLVFDGQTHGIVPAAALWDKVVSAAYACGDPGIIFLDRLQQDNPVPKLPIIATNPCVTGDTRLATQFGMVSIGELYARGDELRVTVDRRTLGQSAGGTEVRPAVPAFMTAREADVYRVVTEDGYEIKVTEWHEFYTTRGKLPLRELKPGDNLLVQSGKGQFGTEGNAELGMLLGLITGDGHFTNRGRGVETVVLNFRGEDRVLAPPVAATVNAMIVGQAQRPCHYRVSPVSVPERNHLFIRSVILARMLQRYGFTRESKLRVPDVIWRGTEACVKAYLRALFQADGTVNVSGRKRSCSVRLASSRESLLKDVQILLANFGVFCRIRKRREVGIRRLPDGHGKMREYVCRADYELIIDGESRERFMTEIGFLLERKSERYYEWVKDKALRKTQPFVSRVIGIDLVGREPVFDTSQADHNTVIFNGLVTGQCGEQPLSSNESCLLGSVNLARMILPDGRIDWHTLHTTTTDAVRFLDNLIDVAEYPHPAIADAARATRKIGIGFTGLADALIAAGLPYDSNKGREYAAQITKALHNAACQASQALGEEKGCFPLWEESVFYPDTKRRNAACITIAPTGSVTVLAGCEGYGVEPLFAVAYQKATEIAGSFAVFSPLFLEACRKHNIPESVLAEVALRGSCQDVPRIPAELAAIYKGAQEISAEDHLLMQAAVQKHVCNAVSKTINLPASALPKEISSAYQSAYRLGLKGVTVFRDSCKQGTITVGSGSAKPQVSQSPEPLPRGAVRRRSKVASGETIRLDTGCGKLYLTANRNGDGDLFETFITTGSDGGCLVYTEATSRLISLALRGGIHVNEILEQLQSAHACPSYMLARGKGKPLSDGKSCASAIANAIKSCLTCREETDVKAEREHVRKLPCPDCGGSLDLAEGCMVCRECGYSKC